ncbi:tetratricopeptide repeat protein [bacterium]|nr:tetratricopeptide repeat protein [bacterium]
MEKHKMTKHEMKEDKFVTTMVQGASYAKENMQSVIIMVLVLVVLVAGIVILKNYSNSKAEKAQSLLGIAQVAYQANEFSEARDSLLVLVDKYPKTDAYKVGSFLLGHIYYSSGSPDSAEIYWNAFLQSGFEDMDMIIGARAGLAGVKSDRAEYKSAAFDLEALYNEYPEYFDRANLLYKAALNYKSAGNPQKTKELLTQFIEEYPENPMIVKAKFFLSASEAV